MTAKKTERKKGTQEARVAEYVRSSLMRQRVRFGNALSCVIDGNYGTYQTRVVMGQKRIRESECSCPSEYWPCKHAHALVETYRQNPNSFVDVEKKLASLGKKSKEELLALIGQMAQASPPSLRALGVKGFEEVGEEGVCD